MATAQNIWSTNQQFRVKRELYWKPKIYKDLLQMIRDATDFPSTQLVISNLPISIDSKPIAATITALYTDAGRVMGGYAYQSVKKQAAAMQKVKGLMPLGFSEDLVNEIIKYFTEHLLDKVVLPITETTRAWILKRVIEGQQQGLGVRDIAESLLIDDFPKTRAYVITRTEVLRAANFGSQQGAKKAGYKLKKYWIAAQDFRTRRIPRDQFSHLAMNGVKLEMEQPYQVPQKTGSVEELMFPGDPNGSAADVIQCRCTEGYEVQRGSDGLPIAV